MGLELGSPWLVLAKVDNAFSTEATVLCRDNFTGAGLKRIIDAQKHEPNSYFAVMDKYGRFALNGDGTVFDPVATTVGRYGGTMAERGHAALKLSEAIFREMPRPENIKQRPWWAIPSVIVIVLIALYFRDS